MATSPPRVRPADTARRRRNAHERARTHALGIERLDFGRDVEKALGPQKPRIPRSAKRPVQANIVGEGGLGRPRREVEVPASPFRVEPERNGDRFEQSGLSRTVLADEERHGRMQLQCVQRRDRRDVERILEKRRDLLPHQLDGGKEGTIDVFGAIHRLREIVLARHRGPLRTARGVVGPKQRQILKVDNPVLVAISREGATEERVHEAEQIA